MLSISETLTELVARGFRIETDGERLNLKGQAKNLTPELKAAVAFHKALLVECFAPVANAETLSDEVVIPAYVANEIAPITLCVNSQRTVVSVTAEQAAMFDLGTSPVREGAFV